MREKEKRKANAGYVSHTSIAIYSLTSRERLPIVIFFNHVLCLNNLFLSIFEKSDYTVEPR